MKTTGVRCETKFGHLGFLGHPSYQFMIRSAAQPPHSPPDCDLKVLPSRPTMLSALLHLILQHLPKKIFKSKSAKWKSAHQFKTNFSCLIIFRHTEEGWLHKVSSIEKCLWTVKVVSFKEISITPSKLTLLFHDRLILQKIDTAWSSLPIHLIIHLHITYSILDILFIVSKKSTFWWEHS